MNSNKQFIAIDLGSSCISAMAAEVQADGALRILGFESKISDDVKHGVVEQRTGASSKIIEIKKLLQNSSKIHDISMVSVGIGAKSMKLMPFSVTRFILHTNHVTITLLDEMHEECKRNFQHLNFAVFDIIPVAYYLDGVSMDDPVGKVGSQLKAEFNVVVGNTIVTENLGGFIDRTGLVLEYSPLAAEALSTVLLEDKERVEGCALINFGGTTTTLAVYHNEVLQHFLIVPLGAKNITKDIQELGISEQNAERLKCLKGNALESLVEDPIYVQIPSTLQQDQPVKISTKFLATIIEARLDEIMQPIFDVLSNLKFDLEAGIVITGGGSKLNNLIDYMNVKTNVYTRFGDHSDWLADNTDEKYYDPIYAQLVGTIFLTDEYRSEHPVEETVNEPEKKPKLPSKKFGEKITQKVFNFFNDDNKLN